MRQAFFRFAVLGVLYLMLAGQVTTDEVVAGALCGGAATAISLLVRHRTERRFQFWGGGGLHLLIEALARLPSETWRVARQLARPVVPAGVLRLQPGPAAEPGPQAAALRALSTFSASLTPNSYVVAELTQRRELLLHVMVDDEPRRTARS